MTDVIERAMLVYQAGIANVFQVDCFNLSSYGRAASRLYQSTFRGAETFCRGLIAAGVTVRVAHCNMAGDIQDQRWSEDFDDAPFRESMRRLIVEVRAEPDVCPCGGRVR